MGRRLPGRSRAGSFLWRVLPAALVLFSGIVTVLAVLIYGLTHPAAVPESTNPSNFWLPSSDVTWNTREGKPVAGWWIPGRKGGPGIVLVPGYGMSRSDVLSLASALSGHGFSLLTYDQRGSGAAPRGASSLGLCETDDLLAALDFLKSRPELDTRRAGVYGVDVGARAALRAAAARPEVRVIVADSVFDSIDGFIDCWIHEHLGLRNRLLELSLSEMFGLCRLGFSVSAHEKLSLEALADRSLLLIQGDNRKELGRQTADLYERIRPRKEMVKLPVSRVRNMSIEEVGSYDRQVADYFQLNLP